MGTSSACAGACSRDATARRVFPLAALACLGLAACGGGSPSKTTAQKRPATVAAATATAAAATTPRSRTTTAKAHGKSTRPSHANTGTAKPRVNSGAGASTPAAPASRAPAARASRAPAPASHSETGPSPSTCLVSAHLRGVRQVGRGVWSADAGSSGSKVSVDGPYHTSSAAMSSAKARAVTDDAQQGGMYVVSAARTSRLAAQVHTVASCLGGSGGQSSYTF